MKPILLNLCLVLCAALLSAVPVSATPAAARRGLSQAANLSSDVPLVVTPTTVTLVSSQNPASVAHSLTFTATVAPVPDGGTLTFKASGVDIAGCVARPLSAGQATCTSAALAAGVQPVTAAYSGSAAYAASTSVGLFQGVYTALQITTGWAHTCARKTSGTLACWGFNSDGQTSVPAPNVDWVQVDADGYHTCGLRAAGTIDCWGANGLGANNVPAPNAGWVQVSAGYVHTCAIKANGAAACWGHDDFGQIAVPDPNTDWVQVSAGDYFSCGLKTDGRIVCWGLNGSAPTTVPDPNANWVQVAAGNGDSCGIRGDGTLQCWGHDIFNDGKNTVPIPNQDWGQVISSLYHTCGVKAGGALLCWGRNTNGQTNVPGPNADWVQVGGGAYHSCGLKADGTIRCWGSNAGGQAPVISFLPANLPDVRISAAYARPVSAYGGSAEPYTFTVKAGAVPTGLSFNSDGTWSGKAAEAGVFNFTVQAVDANQVAATKTYTIKVLMNMIYLPAVTR